MALTRRNALLGLVVLVVAAGMIGASGAFSSVQAERTMDIETAGDNAALLGLYANDGAIAKETEGGTGATGGLETLAIGNQSINENAVTKFEDAFAIRNNGEDPVRVYIEENTTANVELKKNGAVDFTISACGTGADSCNVGDSVVDSDGSTNYVELGAQGGQVNVTVVIDTTGQYTQESLPKDGTLTIYANETA